MLYARIWDTSLTRRSAQTLRETLQGLTDLCVAEWSLDEDLPPLAQSLPLFEQIHVERDRFVFVVGEGLLGSLEQFAVKKGSGLAYEFPNGKRLKALRQEQRVQDLYLPIYLGQFTACKRFSARQKRLFQAIIHEAT